MTLFTSADLPRAMLPEEVGPLVLQPTLAQSVAAAGAGVITLKKPRSRYRLPIITADPTAQWVAEGAEIPVSDPELDEVSDDFHKVAGLTIITREMANDTDPAIAALIGDGIARNLAKTIDAAYFGSRGESTLPPEGLEDLENINTIDAGSAWANVDPFTEALYGASDVGTSLLSFVANPADAVALAKVKRGKDSNEPLLGPDPTKPGRQQIQGVPLLTSPYVTEGTVWGLPANRARLIVNENVTIDVDRSVYFTSDRIAIKGTMRVTTLYPHQEAVQKIMLTSGD